MMNKIKTKTFIIQIACLSVSDYKEKKNKVCHAINLLLSFFCGCLIQLQ